MFTVFSRGFDDEISVPFSLIRPRLSLSIIVSGLRAYPKGPLKGARGP